MIGLECAPRAFFIVQSAYQCKLVQCLTTLHLPCTFSDDHQPVWIQCCKCKWLCLRTLFQSRLFDHFVYLPDFHSQQLSSFNSLHNNYYSIFPSVYISNRIMQYITYAGMRARFQNNLHQLHIFSSCSFHRLAQIHFCMCMLQCLEIWCQDYV